MSGPDWTEGNVHDPGWTLLELFAFLREQLLFRATGRRLVAALALVLAFAWWRRRDG